MEGLLSTGPTPSSFEHNRFTVSKNLHCHTTPIFLIFIVQELCVKLQIPETMTFVYPKKEVHNLSLNFLAKTTIK